MWLNIGAGKGPSKRHLFLDRRRACPHRPSALNADHQVKIAWFAVVHGQSMSAQTQRLAIPDASRKSDPHPACRSGHRNGPTKHDDPCRDPKIGMEHAVFHPENRMWRQTDADKET